MRSELEILNEIYITYTDKRNYIHTQNYAKAVILRDSEKKLVNELIDLLKLEELSFSNKKKYDSSNMSLISPTLYEYYQNKYGINFPSLELIKLKEILNEI
jgi:hypothetical protein